MAHHWKAALMLVAVLCLGWALPPAVATGDSAGTEPPPAADLSDASTTTQIDAFDDLPAGLAGALARSLAGELPADYHFSSRQGGFQTADATYRAANPAQSLSFTFSPVGLQVRDSAGTWTWGLSLVGIGRGEQIAPAPPAELLAGDTLLEYHRGSALTEWYLNSAWGLEQGFTLSAPPGAGSPGGEPVILKLALSGDLVAELDGEDTLLLRDASGQAVARYAGLHAFDAGDQALPASLALTHDGSVLSIQVDDSSAQYPLTIDPWIQVAQITGEEPGEDLLGASVAIDGDTVVVGAPYDDDNGYQTGAVYIFSEVGGWSGTPTEVAKLTPADPVALTSRFGHSVAVSGDTVVVGSWWSQTAYVFEKAAGGWTATAGEVAKLTTSDPGGYLGLSVAISGETIVVGAPGADIGANRDQGAAYVYVRPGSNWAGTLTETARLTASDGAQDDALGGSVAISGDTVVAGTYRAKVGGNTSQGAAYVFLKPVAGWTSTSDFDAKLTASDGLGGHMLGGSVAISGETVVAGAHGAEVGGNFYQGAAYVFVKPAGGWTDTNAFDAKLTASDGVQNDMFGGSVAISGDTIVAAAAEAIVGGSPRRGAAYVYVKPAGGWADTPTFDAKLTASDGAAHDALGTGLAISGDTLVAGAPGYRTGQGAVYVYEKPGPGWSGLQTEAARLIASDGGAGDAFGTSVAFDGDTLVVGAPEAVVDNKPAQGAVYVYVRSGAGWGNASAYDAKLTASDGEEYNMLGRSVAISGGTIVAGAPQAQVGANLYQGTAYVFERPGAGWAGPQTEAAKLNASDGTEHYTFGHSVAISDDTVVVGTEYANTAYVFTEPGSGWVGTLTEAAKLTASDGGGTLGSSVAIDEDTVVAGAPTAHVIAGHHQGAAYVFLKPQGGWAGLLTEAARLLALDVCAFCGLGHAVAVNGDTVVAGDPNSAVGGFSFQGAVYVFLKPATGWGGIMTESATLAASDGHGNDNLGTSVAMYANTIVAGAPAAEVDGNHGQGAVHVFDKPPDGWAPSAAHGSSTAAGTLAGVHDTKLTAGDGRAYDGFGNSVAISSDMLAAGASAYRSDQGAVYLFESEPSTIIVQKQTEPGGDSSFWFSQDIDGSGDFALADGGSQTFLQVQPDRYTVTEIDPESSPGGYDLTDLVCQDSNPSGMASTVDLESRTATVNLERSETVTCTFTNSQHGTIVVEKQTYPGGDPGPFVFSGALSGSLGDGDQLETQVPAGTYTVQEVVPGGWELTSVECDDSNSWGDKAQGKAVFEVSPGEKVTCTFTNSQQGTVTIVKDSLPQSPQAFNFDGDLGSFSLVDDGQSYNARTVKNLPPGLYTVRETLPADWHLHDIRCVDEDGGTTVDVDQAQATIDLDEGEAVVCTFENRQAGTIVVAQETVPPGDPTAFAYTGDVLGQAHDGQRLTRAGLQAGAYTSRQLVPRGWQVTGIECDDGESSGELETATAIFRLQPGETVTCTFTDAYRYTYFVYLPLWP